MYGEEFTCSSLTVGSGLTRDENCKGSRPKKSNAFYREGWPAKDKTNVDDPTEKFWKIAVSLSTYHGCLFYRLRAVIPAKLQSSVLSLLHQGHFGVQKMKQLAHTAFYWPNIDYDIADLCRKCTTCAIHQNAPPKAALHPWMLPKKPWSRFHLDHAINFTGHNWLAMVDGFSKYPCIDPTQSVLAKTTMNLLEQDFGHFGYPHTLMTDNAPMFMSDEFQDYCQARGIVHLTGAPYHPATNGAMERLVQTFRQSLRKSDKAPRDALFEFLIQYRRTPTASGYSPSELLTGRQIRTKLDFLLPSPAHCAQGKQARIATKAQSNEVLRSVTSYEVGDPCYALYYEPCHSYQPRWVPTIVTKRHGTRNVKVRVLPRGPT